MDYYIWAFNTKAPAKCCWNTSLQHNTKRLFVSWDYLLLNNGEKNSELQHTTKEVCLNFGIAILKSRAIELLTYVFFLYNTELFPTF